MEAGQQLWSKFSVKMKRLFTGISGKKKQLMRLLKIKHNPRYLSDVEINLTRINISNDINEVVENSSYLILVTPSAFLESELQKDRSGSKR